MIASDKDIIAAVTTAVALHKDTKAKLAARMEALLAPLPGSLTLAVGAHRIAYRTVYAECSQWGNGAYPVTGSATTYVIDGQYVIRPIKCDHFDGHNQQWQIRSNRWKLKDGSELREVPAGILREIAKALPAALLQYAECCRAAAAEHEQLAAA